MDHRFIVDEYIVESDIFKRWVFVFNDKSTECVTRWK